MLLRRIALAMVGVTLLLIIGVVSGDCDDGNVVTGHLPSVVGVSASAEGNGADLDGHRAG